MTMTRQTLVKRLLHAYGEAMRSDWSFMDGRRVRDDLKYISSLLDSDKFEPIEVHLEKLDLEKDEEYGLWQWRR